MALCLAPEIIKFSTDVKFASFLQGSSEACSEFFSSVRFHFKGQKYFHQRQIFCSPHLEKILPLGNNNRRGGAGGAEYLIITEDKLVLTSAPYAHHESFFNQGQKHTSLNFIRGICPSCPQLYTPLSKVMKIYEVN